MIGSVDERDLAIGSVYAASLLGLAEEQGQAEDVGEELADLAETIATNPAFAGFLADPLLEATDRSAALEKILRGRASDLLVDALQVINRKGRLALVPAVAEAYRLALEELRGQVDAEVVTAVALTERQRARLIDAAQRFSGRQPRLTEKVDESLLGGLVLKIGDQKFDTSVVKELRRLRDRLVERASAEIHDGRRFFAEADGENAR